MSLFSFPVSINRYIGYIMGSIVPLMIKNTFTVINMAEIIGGYLESFILQWILHFINCT